MSLFIRSLNDLYTSAGYIPSIKRSWYKFWWLSKLSSNFNQSVKQANDGDIIFFPRDAKTIWKGIDTRKRRILFELGINRVPLKWVCLLETIYLHLHISHPLKPFATGRLSKLLFLSSNFNQSVWSKQTMGILFFFQGTEADRGSARNDSTQTRIRARRKLTYK